MVVSVCPSRLVPFRPVPSLLLSLFIWYLSLSLSVCLFVYIYICDLACILIWYIWVGFHKFVGNSRGNLDGLGNEELCTIEKSSEYGDSEWSLASALLEVCAAGSAELCVELVLPEVSDPQILVLFFLGWALLFGLCPHAFCCTTQGLLI